MKKGIKDIGCYEARKGIIRTWAMAVMESHISTTLHIVGEIGILTPVSELIIPRDAGIRDSKDGTVALRSRPEIAYKPSDLLEEIQSMLSSGMRRLSLDIHNHTTNRNCTCCDNFTDFLYFDAFNIQEHWRLQEACDHPTDMNCEQFRKDFDYKVRRIFFTVRSFRGRNPRNNIFEEFRKHYRVCFPCYRFFLENMLKINEEFNPEQLKSEELIQSES